MSIQCVELELFVEFYSIEYSRRFTLYQFLSSLCPPIPSHISIVPSWCQFLTQPHTHTHALWFVLLWIRFFYTDCHVLYDKTHPRWLYRWVKIHVKEGNSVESFVKCKTIASKSGARRSSCHKCHFFMCVSLVCRCTIICDYYYYYHYIYSIQYIENDVTWICLHESRQTKSERKEKKFKKHMSFNMCDVCLLSFQSSFCFGVVSVL